MLKVVTPFLLLGLVGCLILEEGVLTQGAIASPETAPGQTPQQRSLQSSLQVSFNPPRRGAPPATVGLGSRGDCLENRTERLQVLMPLIDSDTTENQTSLGLTTASHPTLLAYIPAYSPTAQAIQFRMMRVTENDQETELYTQTFALPPNPGIVQLQTDSSLPALEGGQLYHWYVSIVCNTIDQSGNPTVDGWVERTTLDAALAAKLSQATRLQQAQLYGQAGIWNELVLALVDLQPMSPDRAEWQRTWQSVLQSAGLEAIASAPLLSCCQSTN